MVISFYPAGNCWSGFFKKIKNDKMPKLQQNFTLDISPEKFLNNCSPFELQEVQMLIQGNYYQKKMNSQVCQICGCTDYDCRECIERTGEPCYWFSENLCSACADSCTQPSVIINENGSEN